MPGQYYSLGDETERVEFKKSTGEIKEAVISISAILNKHGGGDLYFGVKNNGDVIGQEITDKTTREVSQAIGSHLRPVIYPEITKEIYDGRTVIHVRFEGHTPPYTAYNIPRIRVADEDLVMAQDIYDDMIRMRDDFRKSWERQVSEYHIADIDRAVFERYLKRAREVGRITFDNEDPESVLNKLELANGDFLLNAGAALFVDCGINDLQMAKFASNERITFTDIRRQTGSILGLVEIAMQYLIDAMDWRAEFGGLHRKEIPEVPVDALREAVINAFAHRQIESGQSIQLMVYRNRIEIYSPGAFPERITPEEFAEGNQKAIRRNKLITQALYYSKDMETFASGLKKIKTLCDEAGVKYEFQKEAYGFTVVFFRHCGEGWGWSGSQEDIVKDNVPHDVPHNVPHEETLADLIETAIRENPHTTRAIIAEKAGVSVKTIARELKKMDHIRYVGSGNNGRWVIEEKSE